MKLDTYPHTAIDMSLNNEIANHLNDIADIYQNARDTYRTGAYRKAAQSVRLSAIPINSGYEARSLGGVGDSIAVDIDEFIRSRSNPPYVGTSNRMKQLMVGDAGKQQVLKLFKGVYGIGPETAEDLYNRGFRTLDNLMHANLNDAQRWGLHYYHHLKEKIPRSEIDETFAIISRCLQADYGHNLVMQVVGSYRRGKLQSGDIDILVRGDKIPSLGRPLHPADVAVTLQKCGIVPARLGVGDHKYAAIVRLDEYHNGRRLDVLVIPPESWAYGLLYFTGSDIHNRLMREWANSNGYTLNEYGLKDRAGNWIPATTEEDIYKFMHLQYLEPSARTEDLKQLPMRVG